MFLWSVFALLHVLVGRVMKMKSHLTISNSKLLGATSIVDDVKDSEYDWETEKCVIVYCFSGNAVFANQ